MFSNNLISNLIIIVNGQTEMMVSYTLNKIARNFLRQLAANYRNHCATLRNVGIKRKIFTLFAFQWSPFVVTIFLA